MPQVQIALKAFRSFGFLQKINMGRFAKDVSSPRAGFRPRQDKRSLGIKLIQQVLGEQELFVILFVKIREQELRSTGWIGHIPKDQ